MFYKKFLAIILYVYFGFASAICYGNIDLSDQILLRTDTMPINEWIPLKRILDNGKNTLMTPKEYIQLKFNENRMESPIFFIGEDMNSISYDQIQTSPIILQIKLNRDRQSGKMRVQPFYIKGYYKAQQIHTEKIFLNW